MPDGRPLFLSIRHTLRALILGAAVALAVGGYAAGQTPAPEKAKPLPVKAPPQAQKKPKKPVLIFDYIDAKPESSRRPYSADIARQHVSTLSWDLAALAAVGTAVGVTEWGWGERSFHVTKEGWFGRHTEFGGIDKLGHAYGAQLMSDYITWRLRAAGYNGEESSLTAAILTGAAFTAVELGDGFSRYGASYEDLIASAAGIAFSYLGNNVPGLHDKVDFRMQYVPTMRSGDFVGAGDYDGKKFLLAWKLGGFDRFKDTPLRYFEIHTGYYTRGYTGAAVQTGNETRTAYVGLGLNLSELLFSQPGLRDTDGGSVIRAFNKYFQLPYTYVASDGNSGR